MEPHPTFKTGVTVINLDKTFLKDALQLAEKAAREAGSILTDYFHKSFKIEYKGDINPVTEADLLSQEKIISILKSEYPHHGFIAEEGDTYKQAEAPYRWIIDPLDGTVNYSHGHPFFCVSLALMKDDEIVAGLVFAPLLNELFTAMKGGGAYLNGAPINVSSCETINRGLLCTGFPYDIQESHEDVLGHFHNFVMAAQGIRRDGAAALDLCYVACGRFDGFWELKLYPWDVAAGGLIVIEAGGRITDYKGAPFDPFAGNVLASNGTIQDQMLSVLEKASPGTARRAPTGK